MIDPEQTPVSQIVMTMSFVKKQSGMLTKVQFLAKAGYLGLP